MTERFVYVTYIRTTAEQLWQALFQPEFTKKYWKGVVQECEWKKGSPWRMIYPDGRVTDAGEVLEIEAPRRLVLSWRNEFMPELKAEGFSRATFELETLGEAVNLTITHQIDHERSKFIEAVSDGWPRILANLKSMLETGQAFADDEYWPKRA